MAVPDRQNSSRIELTEQDVLNQSFDKAYKLLTVQLAKYDPVSQAMVRDTNAGSDDHASNQVSIADTATQIVGLRANRQGIVIINNSNTDIFIGDDTVTDTTGALLLGVKGSAITIETTAAIYGVVASGTATVSYMELF